MGLEIPTLAIGAKVKATLGSEEGKEFEVVRLFTDAVVVENTADPVLERRRIYLPASDFDRWEVVSRPRYTLEDGSGYL